MKQIYKRKPTNQLIETKYSEYLTALNVARISDSTGYALKLVEFRLLMYLGTKSQHLYVDEWVGELCNEVHYKCINRN